MSDLTKQLTPFIITLSDLKPQQRRKFLESCNNKHIRGLEEVCLNICKNSVPLNEDQLKTCKKWRKKIRLLALKRYPLKKKKELLVQRGGFLPALLPVIASVLGAVLSR